MLPRQLFSDIDTRRRFAVAAHFAIAALRQQQRQQRSIRFAGAERRKAQPPAFVTGNQRTAAFVYRQQNGVWQYLNHLQSGLFAQRKPALKAGGVNGHGIHFPPFFPQYRPVQRVHIADQRLFRQP